jgi:parvulin-like peptidyl-prolyl isomerase
MTVILQVGNRAITAEEIIPLLANYQLLPQLLRELVVDEAIAPFSCTPEETAEACQRFYEQNQLTTEEARQAWLEAQGFRAEQLATIATRNLRIQKFKQETWGNKLEAYFLQRKAQLDRVIYSLIRVKEQGTANELYFRLQDDAQSFAELARQYSQGPEAQTGGLIGPVEMSTPHPALARMLAASQPGQLLPPTRIGEWIVIVRLEKLVPVQLDDTIRRQLLEELFNNWMQEQLKQVKRNQNQRPKSAATKD